VKSEANFFPMRLFLDAITQKHIFYSINKFNWLLNTLTTLIYVAGEFMISPCFH